MTETTQPGGDHSPTLSGVLRRTRYALEIVATRRDTLAVLGASILAYVVVYSYATSAIALNGQQAFSLQIASDPFSNLLRQTGFLTFEPIARLQMFGLSYLFSPIDATIALVLAVLVGLNLAITYLGIVQPQACGLAPTGGVLASIPALLSGAACCGPIIFVVLGIQATGILLTGVQLLLPLSLILLIGSLLIVGQRIDPAAVDVA